MLIPVYMTGTSFDKPEEWMDRVPAEGERIVLMPDNGNLYEPSAVTAYYRNTPLGYVSPEYAILVRENYPGAVSVAATVMQNVWDPLMDHGFYVEVELEQKFMPWPSHQLDCSPLADVPLPACRVSHTLDVEEVMRRAVELEPYFDGEHVDLGVSESVIDTARRLEHVYGQSLSGDDELAWCQIMLQLQSAMTYCTDNLCDIYSEMLDLRERRLRLTTDSHRLTETMQNEQRAVVEDLTTFLAELDAAIASGLTTRKELLDTVDARLRALPSRLYAYLDDATELATRLFALRLSARELYMIYTLLCVREHYGEKPKVVPAAVAQPHKTATGFHYWAPGHISKEEQRHAIETLREIAETRHRYCKPLVDEIRHLQNQHIFAADIHSFSQFVLELNALLAPCSRHISYSSIKQYWPD